MNFEKCKTSNFMAFQNSKNKEINELCRNKPTGNTPAFLQKLLRQIDKASILVTFDDELPCRVSQNFVLDGIKQVLEKKIKIKTSLVSMSYSSFSKGYSYGNQSSLSLCYTRFSIS